MMDSPPLKLSSSWQPEFIRSVPRGLYCRGVMVGYMIKTIIGEQIYLFIIN